MYFLAHAVLLAWDLLPSPLYLFIFLSSHHFFRRDFGDSLRLGLSPLTNSNPTLTQLPTFLHLDLSCHLLLEKLIDVFYHPQIHPSRKSCYPFIGRHSTIYLYTDIQAIYPVGLYRSSSKLTLLKEQPGKVFPRVPLSQPPVSCLANMANPGAGILVC